MLFYKWRELSLYLAITYFLHASIVTAVEEEISNVTKTFPFLSGDTPPADHPDGYQEYNTEGADHGKSDEVADTLADIAIETMAQEESSGSTDVHKNDTADEVDDTVIFENSIASEWPIILEIDESVTSATANLFNNGTANTAPDLIDSGSTLPATRNTINGKDTENIITLRSHDTTIQRGFVESRTPADNETVIKGGNDENVGTQPANENTIQLDNTESLILPANETTIQKGDADKLTLSANENTIKMEDDTNGIILQEIETTIKGGEVENVQYLPPNETPLSENVNTQPTQRGGYESRTTPANEASVKGGDYENVKTPHAIGTAIQRDNSESLILPENEATINGGDDQNVKNLPVHETTIKAVDDESLKDLTQDLSELTNINYVPQNDSADKQIKNTVAGYIHEKQNGEVKTKIFNITVSGYTHEKVKHIDDADLTISVKWQNTSNVINLRRPEQTDNLFQVSISSNPNIQHAVDNEFAEKSHLTKVGDTFHLSDGLSKALMKLIWQILVENYFIESDQTKIETSTEPSTTTTDSDTSINICMWSPWLEWSVCSDQSGRISPKRTRTRHGVTLEGMECPGSRVDIEPCVDQSPCIKNNSLNETSTRDTQGSQWMTWSMWSACSMTCGEGEEVRNRTCIVDAADDHCHGEYVQIRNCQEKLCRRNTSTSIVASQWMTWGMWSECSVSCGEGGQLRNRTCIVNADGDQCIDDHDQIKICQGQMCGHDSSNTTVVPQWMTWNTWSACSMTCGEGEQVRSRTCTTNATGDQCIGEEEQIKICQGQICGSDSSNTSGSQWMTWSMWSACSMACGEGEQIRNRTCIVDAESNKCIGEQEQIKICQGQICGRDPSHTAGSQWMTWNMWSTCSVTCGEGKQIRNRTCIVDAESDKCIGEHEQIKICQGQICGSDSLNITGSQWMTWSMWSACSVTFGEGLQVRNRSCMVNANGDQCAGEHEHNKFCHRQISGPTSTTATDILPRWASWTECTATCGLGVSRRTLSCLQPFHIDDQDINPNCSNSGHIQETRHCLIESCFPRYTTGALIDDKLNKLVCMYSHHEPTDIVVWINPSGVDITTMGNYTGGLFTFDNYLFIEHDRRFELGPFNCLIKKNGIDILELSRSIQVIKKCTINYKWCVTGQCVTVSMQAPHNESRHTHKCICPKGYVGERCETEIFNYVPLVAVLLAVLLIFIVVVIVKRLMRIRKGGKRSPPREESNSGHAKTFTESIDSASTSDSEEITYYAEDTTDIGSKRFNSPERYGGVNAVPLSTYIGAKRLNSPGRYGGVSAVPLSTDIGPKRFNSPERNGGVSAMPMSTDIGPKRFNSPERYDGVSAVPLSGNVSREPDQKPISSNPTGVNRIYVIREMDEDEDRASPTKMPLSAKNAERISVYQPPMKDDSRRHPDHNSVQRGDKSNQPVLESQQGRSNADNINQNNSLEEEQILLSHDKDASSPDIKLPIVGIDSEPSVHSAAKFGQHHVPPLDVSGEFHVNEISSSASSASVSASASASSLSSSASSASSSSQCDVEEYEVEEIEDMY